MMREYSHYSDPIWRVALARALMLAGVIATSDCRAQSRGKWKLVWSDEFNGPAGSAPNSRSWASDLGATGWGNQELECYTARRTNSYLDGRGHLVIEARALSTRPNDRACQASSGPPFYTSARLKTEGKRSTEYGRIEARIKIPTGQAIWAAFWMLGDDFRTAGWPKCGEIDIMENIGSEPSTIHGSLHAPGTNDSVTATYALSGSEFWTEYHAFGVEWTPEQIQFYVDNPNAPYFTVERATFPGEWVFNHPFFILLNLAVGGTFAGNPDSSTTFPQSMKVDYVRLYQRSEGAP